MLHKVGMEQLLIKLITVNGTTCTPLTLFVPIADKAERPSNANENLINSINSANIILAESWAPLGGRRTGGCQRGSRPFSNGCPGVGNFWKFYMPNCEFWGMWPICAITGPYKDGPILLC